MSPETIVKIFDGAIKLIEKGWTQDAVARDATGNVVADTDPDAVCFCLVGACNRSCFNLGHSSDSTLVDSYLSYLQASAQKKYPDYNCIALFDMNDNYFKSKEEVLELLKSARELVSIPQN